MEIAVMKRANLDTQNLLTTNTTPVQTMNNQSVKKARSHNPTCAHAHTQRHILAPREPLNLGVYLRVCALYQGRT
jgi:hypothetical protein